MLLKIGSLPANFRPRHPWATTFSFLPGTFCLISFWCPSQRCLSYVDTTSETAVCISIPAGQLSSSSGKQQSFTERHQWSADEHGRPAGAAVPAGRHHVDALHDALHLDRVVVRDGVVVLWRRWWDLPVWPVLWTVQNRGTQRTKNHGLCGQTAVHNYYTH